MTAKAKQIVALPVDTQKSLRLTIRSKPAHLSLLLPSGLVRNFCSVVGVPILAVRHGWHHLAFCGGVTPKLIGSDFDRHLPLITQGLAEEALCSLSILALLHEDLDQSTVLIYGSPQITTLALNRYDDFVEEPAIASRAQAFFNRPGVVGPKRAAPLAEGLVGNCDPTFGQEVFNIAEAQRKPMVEPHRSGNDIGWESVSTVVRILSHA